MKKNYTYEYTRTITGKITVTAEDPDEAEVQASINLEAYFQLEAPDTDEITDLSFKDAEPANLEDRSDDDHA